MLRLITPAVFGETVEDDRILLVYHQTVFFCQSTQYLPKWRRCCVKNSEPFFSHTILFKLHQHVVQMLINAYRDFNQW